MITSKKRKNHFYINIIIADKDISNFIGLRTMRKT